MAEVEDSFVGCLIGLAVGDALGMSVEGLSQEERGTAFGYLTDYRDSSSHPRHKTPLQRGQYTDDTQLSLATVDSLLESPTISFSDMARRFAELYKSGELRRAGYATQQACKRLNQGYSWEESGTKNAEGCGPATRITPLALVVPYLGMKDISDLVDHGTEITHDSLVARQGAAVVFNGVYTLAGKPDYFERTTIVEFIQKLADTTVRMVPKGSSDTRMYDRLMRLNVLWQGEPEVVFPQIGTSGHSLETVPAALYAFLRTPNNFEQAVLTAINAGGDTDSIGAITGAIAGAFNGGNAIPLRWRVNLENYGIILEKAQQLYRSFAERHP